jgi:hypothetical protein
MERDPGPRPAASLAPEHDRSAAARLHHPVLRPLGTPGIDGLDIRVSSGSALPSKPLVSAGPAGLVVAYLIPGLGFGVFTGAEHLQAWSVGPDQVRAAATANLAAWSAGAPWDGEMNGPRQVLWSASGEGMDAARILLPEARARLAAELGSTGRVLVGLPEDDLLVAATLLEDDPEFAVLFSAYVAELASEARDPIDDRVFELVEGELTVFGAQGRA